jgi:hypothetical protein
MFRLKIDLRSTAGTLFEERDFDSEAAARNYYKEVRENYGKQGLRIESRSSLMEHIGGTQAQFWSVRETFTENVKGKMVWRKK